MDFHFINRPHAAFPFSCIQRKGLPSVDPKSERLKDVYDPGVFKLHHLKPIFVSAPEYHNLHLKLYLER